jgi:hypothetical protein
LSNGRRSSSKDTDITRLYLETPLMEPEASPLCLSASTAAIRRIFRAHLVLARLVSASTPKHMQLRRRFREEWSQQ